VNLQTVRPLVAECVATALFVFISAGSVVMNTATSNSLGSLGVALAHGVTLAILVTATMRISGGHVNPAVTVGLWVAGRIDARSVGTYVVAQLVGALVGALCIRLLLPPAAAELAVYGAPSLSASVTLLKGVWIEALLTFFLVSAYFGTAVSAEAPPVGGFGVGLTLLVCVLVAAPLTGAALNPARALAPAIVAGDLHGQIVYWAGPLLGAAVAGLLWKLLLLPRDPTAI
jgi:MIP family channel proteins